MFRAFRSARRKTAHFALAVALAGGIAMGSTAVSAQDYSRGFVEVYQPAAQMTQGEGANPQAVVGQLDAIYAAVETEDDRHAAGNLTLIVGNQINDRSLQRRGLEMMLASGKVSPEQTGLFNYYVGNFAYNDGDYAASRAALNTALAAGYADTDNDPANDPEYIILQSYFSEDDASSGIAYLGELSAAREAAGSTVPERWLLRGLQEAYDFELSSQATDISEQLVRQHTSTQNWINSLQVINALTEFEPAVRVDLFRLMMLTDSLTQRVEFVRFAEDLDPRTMGNEVMQVLEAGIAEGHFTTSDPYYTEVMAVARPRAAQDLRDVNTLIREGESGDALDAMSTANVLLALDDYAQAERFFQLAIDRGGDRNTALTRMGIAQVKQGRLADAQATFAGVTGVREPIARMWSVYAETIGS